MPDESESIHVHIEIPESPSSAGSVDVLLALTDETEDWRAEDELDELKRAALGERKSARPSTRTEKLLLPTPYEFAPMPVREARPSSPPPEGRISNVPEQ